MNKKASKILISTILAKAPHRQNIRIGISGLMDLPQQNKALDEAYIDKFLGDIFDEENTFPQIDYQRKTPFKISSPLEKIQFHIQNIGIKTEPIKTQSIEIETEQRLIQTIKSLLLQKNIISVYYEAERVISTLSSEQASEYKEYLLKIYTWTLNQKSKVNEEVRMQLEDLKNVVVKKLCEAYLRTPENEEIEKELMRLQNVARARQLKVEGELEEAKSAYQKVLKDERNHQAVRREALQFLCEQSLKKGDIDYLVNIKNGLKEKRDSENRLFIEKTLNSLLQLEESGNFMKNCSQDNS